MFREPKKPERPYIPPTLFVLVSVLAGQAALAYELPLWVCLALPASFAVAAVLWGLNKKSSGWLLALCLVALLVGMGSAAWAKAQLAARIDAFNHTSVSRLEFRVRTDPVQTQFGKRCQAEISDGPIAGTRVWLRVPADTSLTRNSRVRGVGRYTPPGTDTFDMRMRAQLISGTVQLNHIQELQASTSPLDRFREAALGFIAPHEAPERALLAGVVCGYRSALKEFGVDELLSLCGLAHLVAVSGSHLSVVAYVCERLLEGLGLSPKVRLTSIALMTCLFVALCGFPASAVRAWIMSLMMFCAQLFGRRSHAISSVCTTALVMALIGPACVADVGFLLSVSSVLGLCLFSRYASYVLDVCVRPIHFGKRFPARLRELLIGLQFSLRASLSTSVVAQCSTAAFTVPLFGRWANVAPVSNALLGPAISALVVGGAAAVVLSWVPMVGEALLQLCLVLCRASLAVAGFLSGLPAAAVSLNTQDALLPALCVAGLLVVLLWWPSVKRQVFVGAGALLAVAAFASALWWSTLSPARFVMLDIGQGDALLFQDGTHTLLVDTGPDPELLLAALSEQHVRKLDAVALTHLHEDHASGVGALCNTYEVGQLIVAQGTDDKTLQDLVGAAPHKGVPKITPVLAHDVWTCGNFEFRVLWPRIAVTGFHNEDSLVVQVSYRMAHGATSSILLTGDAESSVLQELLASGELVSADVLKVGHHGSEVSLTAEQARIIAPSWAVVSAGENNRYGHPTRACVNILQQAGAQLLCTKDVGAITLLFSDVGVQVQTQRERGPPAVARLPPRGAL